MSNFLKKTITVLLVTVLMAVSVCGCGASSAGGGGGKGKILLALHDDTDTFLNVLVAAMALAVFVFVKEKTPKNGKVISRVVDFVRKDLFGIYLTHALWLPVVNTDTIRHCCSEIITLPVISIVVFILSLFTTKLIRIIPYLRKVVE